MDPDVDLGFGQMLRRLKVLPVVLDDGRPLFHGDAEEMGVGEGEPQLGRHLGAFVTGAQEPNVGDLGLSRSGADPGKEMAVFQVVVQKSQEVDHLPGKVANLLGLAGKRQGGRGDLVAAWGPADAQVDAAGVQRPQHAEVLSHF